ncbi:MAG TPA: ABC transporter permease, partial [Candidatus Dormibacteraeota bacterium]|nr:ABC transporter permease [Candidatus Dormibacteraeota bacterium]
MPTLLLLATAPVAAAVLCAMLAPQLAPYDPARGDLSARLQPPAWTAAGSARHLLGTDQLGRDILSRIIFGARVSLLVGVVSSLIGGTVGLALGMLGGYFRGRADSVIA